MNININLPLALFTRVVTAIERLADDYADVHAVDLAIHRQPTAEYKPRVYYQDDRELAKAELEELVKKAAEDEAFGRTN